MPGPRVVPRLGKRGASLLPFDFDLSALTFVAGMAKRAGGAFAGAPIVQGMFDGSGVPDVLSLVRGDQIFGHFYANFDPYQGTASKWWRPELDSGAGGTAYIWYVSSDYYLSYNYTTEVYTLAAGGQTMVTGASAVAAGTDYHVVASWDTKKTVDGTNYARISVNDSHTYGMTTQPTVSAPDATTYIGSDGSVNPANAIEEGVRWDRRIWWDGTYGEPYYFDADGYIDEISAAYAAGAGADPALVEASWDGCMCLPTDSAVGALVTGTGEAWSHPHSSALLNNTWLEDTFGPNQQDVVTFNGTTTSINCGSAAALDDIPAGGGDITIAAWVRDEGTGTRIIACKGDTSTTGWVLRCLVTNLPVFRVAMDTTDVGATHTMEINDGKWHYVVGNYNDTTKEARVAVDGVWGAAATGAGAYTSDAGENLRIGQRSDASQQFWDGDIGHVSIWSDDHHTAGTDFIPPRTKPGAGGTLVESWGLDDGAGANATATVTSPGNDGTIANGTWTEKWEYTGTPVELQSVEYNGTTTNLDGTSGANIDDLPGGANGFTAEGYFRHDDAGESNNGTFWNKTSWYMRMDSVSTVRVFIDYDTTDIDETFTWVPDGRHHNWMLTYNENGADRFARVYRDGVLVHTTAASVGNYVADAAQTLYIGNNAGGTAALDGAIGWQGLSDNVRESGAFLPNTRVVPRANDANMHLRYAMTDGAGAAVADTSGNAYNGTLTNYVWNNVFAQETDAPGERTFPWGYSIGSDGASDGMEQHIAVTAGDDWVLRIPVRYEDATGQASILVYDETGAAAISTFDGPPLTGVHDGLANAAALTDTGNVFPASLVDGIIYNITDGSSGTITAVGGTNQDTITATLAGGTDDDWDIGDVFMLVPPANWVWCEPFCVEMPAGCTEASVQLLNAAGDGVLHWQQAEVQTSIAPTGSAETGAGNPYVLTGWLNSGLDPGDTLTEAVIVHSGAQSLEWAVGAAGLTEFQYVQGLNAQSVGQFISMGGWFVGEGSVGNFLMSNVANRLTMQYDDATRNKNTGPGAVWEHAGSIWRTVQALILPGIAAEAGAGAARYSDDYYLIELDDISLTVTPASEANSLEGTGIRIDGRDQATQVPGVGILQATQGWIRFRWRPRHDAAQAVAFGETGTTDIFDGRAPLANAIQLYWAAANTVQLIVFDGGILGIIWDATGAIVADTEYLVEIRYYPARADLLIDGVVVATGAGGIDFGTDIITLANYGHNNVNADQTDAVFSAP